MPYTDLTRCEVHATSAGLVATVVAGCLRSDDGGGAPPENADELGTPAEHFTVNTMSPRSRSASPTISPATPDASSTGWGQLALAREVI